MDIRSVINEIRFRLTDSFNEVDSWFDIPEDVLRFRPDNGSWTIEQILEHISITNHFLLILVEKGAEKALHRAKTENVEEALKTYTFHREKLDEIGIHKSFPWIRPEHMEPAGNKAPEEIRGLLKMQLKQCLDVLDRLGNGEGVLCKTTMTVNELGKIDVYEYLYFLAQHAQRHITQMKNNKSGFMNNNA